MFVPEQANVETASLRRKKRETTTEQPSFWGNTREYFSEYTAATNLHGFQYLGEKNTTKFERILWLIIIIISLGMCTYLILETYKKWDTTPVIVTLAHNPMPVWKVPFPAVTVCSDMKTRSFYHKYLKNKSNQTESELKLLKDDPLLCQFPSNSSLTTDEDIFQLSEMAGRLKEEVITSCDYSSLEDCRRLFSTVLTEEGVCYTFNSLTPGDIYSHEVYDPTNFLNYDNGVTDWSIEEGYAKSAGKNAFPRRTMFAGIQDGLSVALGSYHVDYRYLCNRTEGYKVILHHPAEMPTANMQYFTLPFDGHVTLAIKPDVVETSNSLRNYDPHKRGCYFANEKQLSYYKNYTQQNCLTECLTNHTLKLCECVSFYMPRRNTTSVCPPESTSCAYRARSEIFGGNAMNEFNESRVDADCDCLPSCTAVTYNTEMSQTKFEMKVTILCAVWSFIYSGPTTTRYIPKNKFVSLNIYFKEMQFITSERNELYGVIDFLANCGGLLGLFVGFSLISLVELFYFLTVRLGINWGKYGRHYWSGSEDLLQNEMSASGKQFEQPGP